MDGLWSKRGSIEFKAGEEERRHGPRCSCWLLAEVSQRLSLFSASISQTGIHRCLMLRDTKKTRFHGQGNLGNILGRGCHGDPFRKQLRSEQCQQVRVTEDPQQVYKPVLTGGGDWKPTSIPLLGGGEFTITRLKAIYHMKGSC